MWLCSADARERCLQGASWRRLYCLPTCPWLPNCSCQLELTSPTPVVTSAQGLLAQDPFDTLDTVGVGELVRLAVQRGRETRPDIELVRGLACVARWQAHAHCWGLLHGLPALDAAVGSSLSCLLLSLLLQGICGEHGGDPASIAFFEEVGLAYVSCSPLRVPIARLVSG